MASGLGRRRDGRLALEESTVGGCFEVGLAELPAGPELVAAVVVRLGDSVAVSVAVWSTLEESVEVE